MADDLEDQEWLRVGVAAELSKQYAADGRRLLDSLAAMLEGAAPGATRVERRGGLFSKGGVRAVQVDLGEDRYSLQQVGPGGLTAARARVVRGIVVKTWELPVDEWLSALSEALETSARTNSQVRFALSLFSEGDFEPLQVPGMEG